MVMRRIVVAVVAMGLCACSGTVDGAVVTSPGAPATITSGAIASSDRLPADLCAFLKAESRELEGVGSEIGALARFAGDFATWVGEDPTHQLTDARELDAITVAQCPDTRARVLDALGGDSFAVVLGG
jgi:hypothetical protein